MYNCAHLRSTKESLTFEYLEKENVTFMENKENIWRGKYFFASEKKNREGNGGKYLEKEIIFFAEEKKNGEGNGGKYLEKVSIFFCRGEGRGGTYIFVEEKKNGEGKYSFV